MTKTLQTILGHSSAKVTLDVPSVRIRRRRIDAGTTPGPSGVPRPRAGGGRAPEGGGGAGGGGGVGGRLLAEYE